jgi:hypothetical protein
MLFKMSRALTTLGVLAIAGSANAAFGQFWFDPCCCCPPPIRVQPAYQTVPVTEMREVRQVVQKPVVETRYVEQPFTEYRQVVENKTAEIPTVSWQHVTEYHNVQRDCGHWSTQYQYRPKMAPCQYDGRPDLFGFLNRTQYSLRMAFTPDYWGERVYTPNVITQQVPVTRQVAVRGTQTVNYQVSKVVPITTTRRVAVNTVKMVAEEIVTQRPVTVMKTIPFGSAYAFGTPIGNSGSRTALQPTPDAGATAILPKDTPKKAPVERSAKLPESEGGDEDDFDTRESDAGESNIKGKKTTRSSLKIPAAEEREEKTVVPAKGEREVAGKTSTRPLGKWVARKKTQPASDGPAFPEMTIARTGTN